MKIKTILTALTVATAMTMTACASKKNDVPKIDTKPVKLEKLTQVQSQIRQITQYNVASAQKGEVLRLRVQTEQGVDFVADPKGEVTAYRDKQRLWQTKVSKHGLTAGVEVADGLVVVANIKGDIIALNQNDGSIAWQTNIASSILAPSLIQQGRVITLANDGTVYGHSAQNGQLMWAYKLPNAKFSLRGQPAPVTADGRSFAVSSSNGYVYIIDAISGLPLIQRRVAMSDGRSELTRLNDIDGEALFIGSFLVTIGYQAQLTVTDLNTQRVLWSEKVSSNKTVTTDGEKIFVSQSDGSVAAYNLASGRELWKNEQLLRRQLSNPVMLDGELIVGDLEGYLHILNPETGAFVGRQQTKGAVNHLYVDNQKLYVSTRNGTLSVWTR